MTSSRCCGSCERCSSEHGSLERALRRRPAIRRAAMSVARSSEFSDARARGRSAARLRRACRASRASTTSSRGRRPGRPASGSICFCAGWCGRTASIPAAGRRCPRRQLVVPLDTHTIRVGRCLRLTRRASPGWKMATDITAALRDARSGRSGALRLRALSSEHDGRVRLRHAAADARVSAVQECDVARQLKRRRVQLPARRLSARTPPASFAPSARR